MSIDLTGGVGRWLLAVTVAAGIAVGIAGCARETSPSAPNVLIIVWDTVRADRLSVYGYEKSTTPFLERFAKEARLYRRAVSPATWTAPSHASLFTGLPVSAHGVNVDHKWLDQRFQTLAEIFSDAGYHTYAFAANPQISSEFNLTQGFGTVQHPWEEPWKERVAEVVEAKIIPGERSSEGWSTKKGFFSECGPVVGEAFAAWLDERQDDAPFFAFLNYMEAHVPRLPTIEARRHVMDDATLQRSLSIDRRRINLLGHMFGRQRYTKEEIDVISAIYDAALVDLDRATETVIDELSRRGMLENTVIVLTSDHGENLGDHDLFGHVYSIYNTLTRVPLIIRYPSRVPPGVAADPVSDLDVFATIIDLAGLASFSPEIPSRSLLDATRTSGPAFSELVAVSPGPIERAANAFGEVDADRWLRTFRSVEEGDYKLILPSDGEDELYDVVRDPGETMNLAAAESGRMDTMRRAIREWLASFDPYDSSLAAPDETPSPLPPSARERLKALGYVD